VLVDADRAKKATPATTTAVVSTSFAIVLFCIRVDLRGRDGAANPASQGTVARITSIPRSALPVPVPVAVPDLPQEIRRDATRCRV
jgi:hypothetical protein